MPRRFRFDQVACRGAADLLIAGEQHRDRQRGLKPGTGQLPHGFQREIVAALHVEDAGAVAARAVLAPWKVAQRADRMHRIQVPEDQDAGLGCVRVREARAHAITKAHPAWNDLDTRAHDGEVAHRKAHHPVDGRGIESRAFAFDPGSKARQHRAGVERKITRVHRVSFACPRLSRVAIQIVCLVPVRDLLARTLISSTWKPALRRRWVNFGSGLAAHTASMPPGRSAVPAALNPCRSYSTSLEYRVSPSGPLSTSSRIASNAAWPDRIS